MSQFQFLGDLSF